MNIEIFCLENFENYRDGLAASSLLTCTMLSLEDVKSIVGKIIPIIKECKDDECCELPTYDRLNILSREFGNDEYFLDTSNKYLINLEKLLNGDEKSVACLVEKDKWDTCSDDQKKEIKKLIVDVVQSINSDINFNSNNKKSTLSNDVEDAVAKQLIEVTIGR